MEYTNKRFLTESCILGDNRNINCIIIRNLYNDEAAGSNSIDDIVNRLGNEGAFSSNMNINAVIIQNIISDEDKYEKACIDSLPAEEYDKTIMEAENRNINMIVIKNIIPIKNFRNSHK